MIKELNHIFQEKGSIKIKAYYKIRNGIKIYYDFQELTNSGNLNGSYDILDVQELLYLIKQQKECGNIHINYTN